MKKLFVFIVILFSLMNIIAYAQNKTVTIFYLMSYHYPWEWSDRVITGFKDALSETLPDAEIEYVYFQMDTKRKISPDWIKAISELAIEKIDELKPDLVFASDDNAQKYVVRNYIDQELPFVFCGVNADPQDYGYPASNVTGVLERIHFIQGIRLLQRIILNPPIKKLAYITDSSITSQVILERVQPMAEDIEDIDITFDMVETFEEWKTKIKEYQTQADGIIIRGYHTLTDAEGDVVPEDIVIDWTLKNSAIPEVTYWLNHVEYGMFCAVAVSAYQQGYIAGKMAAQILLGRKPSQIPIQVTKKGEIAINISRAKHLNIKIPFDLLTGGVGFRRFNTMKYFK